MHELFVVGIVLIVGTFMGHLAGRLRLPRISGYLVAGIFMSPAVTGFFPKEMVTHKLTTLVELGLAIIAFAIGGSLKRRQIRALGRHMITVSAFGGAMAFGLTAALFIFVVPRISPIEALMPSFWQTYLPIALLLGSIGCATAPGAVLAIVREVRARGQMTTMLMGVVALDNILAILLFGLASTSAAFLTTTSPKALSVASLLGFQALELFGSLAVGAAGGALLPLAIRGVQRMEILFVVVSGFVLGCAGLSESLGLSLPIACMALGFVSVNVSVKEEAILDVFLPVDELVFTLFFAVAGMHVDLSVLLAAGPWVPFILAGWFVGKVLGARMGGLISGAPTVVTRFIGWALTPKAGVTMGLVLTVGHYLSDPWMAEVIINAVLASTIINELVTPILVKRSLLKAGEDQEGRARGRSQETATEGRVRG